MTRSPLQPGPATDHWHASVGTEPSYVVSVISQEIHFNTPNLYDSGIPFVSLPEKSVILALFADVVTPFDDDGYLQLIDNDNLYAAMQIQIGSSALVNVSGPFRKFSSGTVNVVAFAAGTTIVLLDSATDCRLFFAFNIAQPTVGSATAYAIIATPVN